MYENLRYVSQETYDNWFRSHPKPGDILLTLKGSQNGAACLVPDPVDFVIAQDMVALRVDEEVIDPLFLFAALRSDAVQTQIKNLDVSGVIPHLKKSDFDKLMLPYPDRDTQRSIGQLYFSLSKKIDLLHRQNKTLEEMAAALFRQWFVEEAQEDWEEVNLGAFFPVVTGKKDANFSTDDGEYPFFTCSQTAIKAPSFSFDGAAILLAGNGDFNVKRYIGKFEAYQRTYVLIPHDIKYFSFLFTLMRYYLSDITGGHQGSVINFITKGMITDFTFSMPKDRGLISKKLEQFNEIYEKVDSNTKQIRALEKLRDTLLPKLMSGEVRVVC